MRTSPQTFNRDPQHKIFKDFIQFYLIKVEGFVFLCRNMTLSFLSLKFRVNKMEYCS
jgi:hypothetical protein